MGDRSEIRRKFWASSADRLGGFKQVMAASSAANGIAPPCPSAERDAVRLASGSFGSKNSPSPKPPLPTGTCPFHLIDPGTLPDRLRPLVYLGVVCL
jgi:hypothetical protein